MSIITSLETLSRTAISADQLPWDPSVQALLPFPSVLAMMASDMNWTTQVGNAFMAQQQDVMDAVQRLRQEAHNFGYLRSNGSVVVSGGPYIAITPVNPGLVYVPYYDPAVVFYAPRPGFFIGGAIRFGYGINIGVAFRPWGWGYNRFDWGRHTIFVNNSPWRRNWVDRGHYVHPYTIHRYTAPRPPSVMSCTNVPNGSAQRRAKAGREWKNIAGRKNIGGTNIICRTGPCQGQAGCSPTAVRRQAETCLTQINAVVLTPETSNRFRHRMFLHITLSSSSTM